MQEFVTIQEKLGITMAEGGTGTIIAALALSGNVMGEWSTGKRLLGPRCGSLAPALLSFWLLGDRHEEAREAARLMARALFERRTGGRVKVRELSDEVLAYWIADECPACHGAKWERIEGTPTLSHQPCRVCRGTGKKQRPWDAVTPGPFPHGKGAEEIERYYEESRRQQLHSRRADTLLVNLDEIVREVARGTSMMMR